MHLWVWQLRMNSRYSGVYVCAIHSSIWKCFLCKLFVFILLYLRESEIFDNSIPNRLQNQNAELSSPRPKFLSFWWIGKYCYIHYGSHNLRIIITTFFDLDVCVCVCMSTNKLIHLLCFVQLVGPFINLSYIYSIVTRLSSQLFLGNQYHLFWLFSLPKLCDIGGHSGGGKEKKEENKNYASHEKQTKI